MKHHKLTVKERETLIRTSDADDCWYVFSKSSAMIRQLKALVERVGGKEEPAQDHGLPVRTTQGSGQCPGSQAAVSSPDAGGAAGKGGPATWPNGQQCSTYGGGNLE